MCARTCRRGVCMVWKGLDLKYTLPPKDLPQTSLSSPQALCACVCRAFYHETEQERERGRGEKNVE